LPDHGELWSAPWSSSVYDHAGGTTLAGRTEGTIFPYEFEREITLDKDEPVAWFRYRVRNLGDTSFPWIWSSHPLLNVQPGSTLKLDGVEQVRIDAVHGRDDLEVGAVVKWPSAIGGDAEEFSFPEAGRWAAKLFGNVGAEGRMSLTDPRKGERLEFVVPPGEVPQVGVWINCRGWAPPGRTPYYNLALEPCIGAPDRLDVALEDWHTAQTLAPGEERRWSLGVRIPG
jgi:galactose mutarotase-like enzyme